MTYDELYEKIKYDVIDLYNSMNNKKRSEFEKIIHVFRCPIKCTHHRTKNTEEFVFIMTNFCKLYVYLNECAYIDFIYPTYYFMDILDLNAYIDMTLLKLIKIAFKSKVIDNNDYEDDCSCEKPNKRNCIDDCSEFHYDDFLNDIKKDLTDFIAIYSKISAT